MCLLCKALSCTATICGVQTLEGSWWRMTNASLGYMVEANRTYSVGQQSWPLHQLDCSAMLHRLWQGLPVLASSLWGEHPVRTEAVSVRHALHVIQQSQFCCNGHACMLHVHQGKSMPFSHGLQAYEQCRRDFNDSHQCMSINATTSSIWLVMFVHAYSCLHACSKAARPQNVAWPRACTLLRVMASQKAVAYATMHVDNAICMHAQNLQTRYPACITVACSN